MFNISEVFKIEILDILNLDILEMYIHSSYNPQAAQICFYTFAFFSLLFYYIKGLYRIFLKYLI